MDPQLEELNRKLDALTAQIAFLTEQAHDAQLARQSVDELIETGMPIARDAMSMMTTELEDVQEYLAPADLTRLLKKAIRHAPQMEMLLDQVDGVTDLIDVVGPIAKEGMGKATSIMEELDRKGYVAFGNSALRIVDTLVCSFSAEDLDRLADALALMPALVKEITQPERLTMLQTAVKQANVDLQKPLDTSLGSLMKQFNDPDVRRGLALSLRILRVIGAQAN